MVEGVRQQSWVQFEDRVGAGKVWIWSGSICLGDHEEIYQSTRVSSTFSIACITSPSSVDECVSIASCMFS